MPDSAVELVCRILQRHQFQLIAVCAGGGWLVAVVGRWWRHLANDGK